MSDIIKNPKRNNFKQISTHQSEYERLGIKPKPFNPNQYAQSRMALNIASKEFTPETVSVVDSSIIDNNEHVSYFMPVANSNVNENESDLEIELLNEVNQKNPVPAVGEYILMISGDIIMTGSMSKVEEKVRNILYGDDKEFASSEINQEDIVILKRVDLQVGVFIRG